MKASELITLLQDAIDKYGDLPLSNDDSEIGRPNATIKLTPSNETGGRDYENPKEFFIEVLNYSS